MCVYIIWEKVILGLKGYVVDYILQSPHSFRTDSTVAEEHLGRKKKKTVLRNQQLAIRSVRKFI